MSIKIKALEAINNNKMIELLEGIGEYKVNLPPMCYIPEPTDMGYIVRIINKLNEEESKLSINKLFENALLEMMDREVFDLYIAFKYVYYQIGIEEKQEATFQINRKSMADKLKICLQKKSEELKNYCQWEGYGQKDGVWSSIEVMNNSLKQEYNISLM